MTKRKEDHKDEAEVVVDAKALDASMRDVLAASKATPDPEPVVLDRGEAETRETRKMAKVGDVPRGEVNAAIREGARRHAERWNPAGRQLSPAEQALVDRGEAVTVYTLLCELERRALANVDVVLGDLRAARELVGPSPQVVG